MNSKNEELGGSNFQQANVKKKTRMGSRDNQISKKKGRVREAECEEACMESRERIWEKRRNESGKDY